MSRAKKCVIRSPAGHLDLNSKFSQSIDRGAHCETQTFEIGFNFRDSIVASIPACHAGDRGSIPRRGAHAQIFLDNHRGGVNALSGESLRAPWCR